MKGKGKGWLCLSVLVILCTMLLPWPARTEAQGPVWYAVPGGSGDCSDWANACDLQWALTQAVDGEEIWVAEGTYKPTTGTDQLASFQLVNGVALYGGFAGGEISRDERNWVANTTILSGNLLGTSVLDSYHVVTGSGTDASAVLDGFTITGGSTGLTGVPYTEYGGGIFNDAGSPTIRHAIIRNNGSYLSGGGMANLNGSEPALLDVEFLDNSAWGEGGGIYNRDSNPTLVDVSFLLNTASLSGGGMFSSGSSNPELTDVEFVDNSVGMGFGGALAIKGGTVNLTNVTFRNNHADAGGGGAIHNSATGIVLLQRCTLDNNIAREGGGASNAGDLTLVNSTVTANKALDHGGGILSGASASTRLYNVTITDNAADADNNSTGDGGGIYYSDSAPMVLNSIIAGNEDQSPAGTLHPDCYVSGSPGGEMVEYNLLGDSRGCEAYFVDSANGNMVGTYPDTIEPLLGRLADNGGPTPTHALLAGSPARDQGNEFGCNDHEGNPLTVDQRGAFRPRDGDTVVGAVCDMGAYEAGLGNDAWQRARLLTLEEPDPNLRHVAVQDLVEKHGQSRWFKFAVQPGSEVQVQLSSLSADYDLTLYKDVGDAFLAMVEPEDQGDLVKLTAEFAPDAYSPDAYSPDAYSPDAYSPDAYSPDAYSPDAYSPDAYSPDDAYAVAQLRTIVGISSFDGTADETIAVNTWDNAGEFYARVRGRNGTFDASDSFDLDVTVLLGTCKTVDPYLPLPAPSVTPGDRRTLILADLGRMNLDPGEEADLWSRLAAFAERPDVWGVVVDLSADPDVFAANSQADNNQECPYAKNLVVKSIKAIVNAYREAHPTLEYVVLVGNDEVIPSNRYPDRAQLANEKNYVPPVYSGSPSYASLTLGYVLSQDLYGSSVDLSLSNTTLPIPDLAVGRLVESYDDVISMLDAYEAAFDQTKGVAVIEPTSALVTGYDFLADVAGSIQGELEQGIGVPPDALTCNPVLLPEECWNAGDLLGALSSPRHDVVFLAGHFSASSTLAADWQTRLYASDVLAPEVDMLNALVYSAGCHSGYNTVNEHGIPNLTVEPDWAQVFAQKGATFIGGTGYQYGDTDFIEYSERLYKEFTKQLRHGSGPVPVGKALVAAKQAYLTGTAQMRGIHEKSVLEATLFGLPMMTVDLPYGRYDPTIPASIVDATAAFATEPGFSLGLEYADKNIDDFSLTPTTKVLDSVVIGGSQMIVSYVSGGDGVVTNPAEPVLPLERRNVSVDGLVLRGVGFRGGNISDQAGVIPLTGAATTEARGMHPPFLSEVFFPIQPWRVNYFDVLTQLDDPDSGVTWLSMTPAQFVSGGMDVWSGTLRQFDNMDFRLYYSNNTTTYAAGNTPAVSAPPYISHVSATPGDTDVTFQVTVLGDPGAGIQEVWVTHTACDGTAACAGTWQSLDLDQNGQDSTLWEGSLLLSSTEPEDIHYVVQAVNGVGLVTMATNLGEYFAVGVDPGDPAAGGDPASPPAETTLNLVSPPTSGAFQSVATFTAHLASGGQNVEGQTVKFALGAQQRQATTGADGLASVEIPLLGTAGPGEVRASFAGNSDYLPSSVTGAFEILRQPTALDIAPASATAQYGDASGVVATLTDDYGLPRRPLLDKTIFFILEGSGPYTVSDLTNYVGEAKLGRVQWPAGLYNVDVYFGGTVPLPDGPLVLDDVNYVESAAAGTLTVTPEYANATYTGDTVVLDDGILNLAALLAQEDDGSPGDLALAEVYYTVWHETGTFVTTVPGEVASDGTSVMTVEGLQPGTYMVGVAVTGGYFASEVGAIDLPLDPAEVETTVSGWATFSDPDSPHGHTAVWDWGDLSQCHTGVDVECSLTEPSDTSPGSVSGTHVYSDPGVYTVSLTVTDASGHSQEATFEYVVIYDPTGGFVTGGGWFVSPEGACRYDTCDYGTTGKANFGFVSKYKKGADTPTGKTEFQFKAAGLNFHSDTYDWLVVAGHKAMFKGLGTINGEGNYGFMISAVDAALAQNTDDDLFRIKIWDRDNGDVTVYDNQMDAPEDADATTAIGGGSIVIHKEKK